MRLLWINMSKHSLQLCLMNFKYILIADYMNLMLSNIIRTQRGQHSNLKPKFRINDTGYIIMISECKELFPPIIIK